MPDDASRCTRVETGPVLGFLRITLFGAGTWITLQQSRSWGKTQAEAIREYQSQGAFLAEDFAYMAAVGLRYYLPPALEYLRSSGDGDFVHGLMCSLHVQVRHRKPLPGDVVDMMKQAARYCDAHRDKFGLDPEEELFDDYVRTILRA